MKREDKFVVRIKIVPTERRALPTQRTALLSKARVAFALIAVCCALAGGCAVDPSGIDIAVTGPADAPAAPSSNQPATGHGPAADPFIVDRSHDKGEQLLPRLVEGTFSYDGWDFVETDPLPVRPECGWLERPLHS